MQLTLKVKDDMIVTEEIEIDDYKMELLSDEEREAAIEINIRQWAEQNIHISWEVDES